VVGKQKLSQSIYFVTALNADNADTFGEMLIKADFIIKRSNYYKKSVIIRLSGTNQLYPFSVVFKILIRKLKNIASK